MMRSLYGHVKNQWLLGAANLTATGTSATVDMQGFASVMFLIASGTFTFATANKLTLAIRDSDDGTTFTAAADADIQPAVESAGVIKVLDGTEDQNSVFTFHYRGTKRYLHVGVTETGTVDSPLTVLAVKSNAELKPPL